MKYIDADKLKAEINERLMSVDLAKLGNLGSHRVWAYNDVKEIITSLQQEQPGLDLASEIEAASKRYPEVSYAKLSRIAKRFYELGFKAKEENK